MNHITRRRFLEFMGHAAVLSTLPACASITTKRTPRLPFTEIPHQDTDDLILSPGLQYKVVVGWGDALNGKEKFGFNNDFTAFLPLNDRNPNEGLLWANNEYHDPYYTRGWRPDQPYTKADIDKDRKEVGGSIVHIKRDDQGAWRLQKNSKYNRRLDGFTKIPMISDLPIRGTKTAVGTMGNCAGGVTPWGTVLTCEENYHNFVGEVEFLNGKRTVTPAKPYLSWAAGGGGLPPEHYGWVVEVDLRTGAAKKLTALGRFAHESATCIQAEDGRTVVYSGDDAADEHLYKFISAKPGSLEKGELFVADTKAGRWLSLDRNKDPRLQVFFKTQTELLIRTREAAKIVGATPLNRPEDVEIDPNTRAVYTSLTAGKEGNDIYGSLLKIEEKNADPTSLEFTASTFLAGGPQNGFANPDNLCFDRKGNLWMCTDISESNLRTEKYAAFANNGLFVIPMSGEFAGRALMIGSAPRGAELTGLSFSPDQKTLFLSVQHPGERALNHPYLTSHWPGGGEALPRPSVVAIEGPLLNLLTRS